jgi:membrane protease YdiL (CAAX protease family)
LLTVVFFVFAQAPLVTFSPITNLINEFQKILERLVPFLISLAVVGFFWFMMKFIWVDVDKPEARQKARVGMAWSIGAIFIMIALWGIITFIASTVGISTGGTMQGFKVPGEL